MRKTGLVNQPETTARLPDKDKPDIGRACAGSTTVGAETFKQAATALQQFAQKMQTLEIKDLIAKDIMTRKPKVLKESYLASFALQQMENYKITSLVIIDDENKPIGIVHLHDLINLGLQQR
ncbi:MAG: CBS domain-containing protein [Candidatus Firestonebacteria bacterium]|nr:CBS domain-containing protein [Candidatus Firestonebacteria bacterium]